jgi:hypothetical protein
MKLLTIGLAYGAVLLTSWELEKFDQLLGYTVGVFGILGITFFLVDYLAQRIH